ncbi:MAG: RNA polymerase subunit sigma-70, partial [Pseudomonadota bacterium]
MSGTNDMNDRHDLAAEYVLGTLSAARRREVEQRLPLDAELRTAVQNWQERLLPLASLAEPVEPAPQLWQRIESSLEKSAAVSAASATRKAVLPAKQNWWDSVKLWRGLAGTGFAATAVLAAVLVTRMGASPAPQYMVVLVAPQDKAPGWV